MVVWGRGPAPGAAALASEAVTHGEDAGRSELSAAGRAQPGLGGSVPGSAGPGPRSISRQTYQEFKITCSK